MGTKLSKLNTNEHPVHKNGTLVRLCISEQTKSQYADEMKTFYDGKIGLLCGSFMPNTAKLAENCRMLLESPIGDQIGYRLCQVLCSDFSVIDDDTLRSEKVAVLHRLRLKALVDDALDYSMSGWNDKETCFGPCGTIVYCEQRDAFGVVCCEESATGNIVVALTEPVWAVCCQPPETIVGSETDQSWRCLINAHTFTAQADLRAALHTKRAVVSKSSLDIQSTTVRKMKEHIAQLEGVVETREQELERVRQEVTQLRAEKLAVAQVLSRALSEQKEKETQSIVHMALQEFFD